MKRGEQKHAETLAKLYAQDAQTALAGYFDIGANICGVHGQQLVTAFMRSGLAREFECGNPAFISGKSGAELVVFALGNRPRELDSDPLVRVVPSEEQWLGRALAHWQQSRAGQFARAFEALSYDEMIALHDELGAESLEAFAAELDEAIEQVSSEFTRLRTLRDAAGLSQGQLAALSGVGLRSIQMYEQRNKDINHASAQTLRDLARTLHCSIEDLLEGF